MQPSRIIKIILLLPSICLSFETATFADSHLQTRVHEDPFFVPEADELPNAHVEKRTLKFPSDGSSGPLVVLPLAAGAGERALGISKLVGKAMGTVSVTIKPDELLMLQLNSATMRDPAKIDKLPPQGIDAIRISFMSMAEDQDVCDTALAHIKRLKNLRLIDLTNSDTTDLGLRTLKDASKLQVINITQTQVTGSCFKDLSALPQLSALVAERNGLFAKENFAYLPKFPKLSYLHLYKCGITDDDTKVLSNCKHLQFLDVGHSQKLTGQAGKYLAALPALKVLNLYATRMDDVGLASIANLQNLQAIVLAETRVTDQGMKYLAKLHKLRALNLTGTAVTMAGLKQLKGLKLIRLILPASICSTADQKQLSQWFPTTDLVWVHSTSDALF